eukprot:tig00000350_g24335.t1
MCTPKSRLGAVRSLSGTSGFAMASDQSQEVRVAPGDTLWSISRKSGVPVDVLCAFNGIVGSNLQVGQKIQIPGAINPSMSSRIPAPASPPAPAPTPVRQHSQGAYSFQSPLTIPEFGEELFSTPRREFQHSTTSFLIGGRSANSNDSVVSPSIPASPLVVEKPAEREGRPRAPKPATGASQRHTVQRGETLVRIATLHNVSVEEIMEANHLASSLIQVGSNLRIPPPSGNSPVATLALANSVISFNEPFSRVPENRAVLVSTSSPSEPTSRISSPSPVREITFPSPAISRDPSPIRDASPAPAMTPLAFVPPVVPPTTSASPAAPAQKMSKQQPSSNYTVKRGDTMVRIARIHGITLEELMELNRMSSPDIRISQKLVVPSVSSTAADAAPAAFATPATVPPPAAAAPPAPAAVAASPVAQPTMPVEPRPAAPAPAASAPASVPAPPVAAAKPQAQARSESPVHRHSQAQESRAESHSPVRRTSPGRAQHSLNNFGSYTVKPGDTLLKIATVMNVPLTALMHHNGLDLTNTIRPGQVLIVPPLGSRRGETARLRPDSDTESDSEHSHGHGHAHGHAHKHEAGHHEHKPVATIGEAATRAFQSAISAITHPHGHKQKAGPTKNRGFHTVKAGDSLQSLALEYGVSAQAIRDSNPERVKGSVIYVGDTLTIPPPPKPVFAKPVISGGWISSLFGWRWGRMHEGVDVAAPVGTPIHATQAGVVRRAGWFGAYGYLVEILHMNGFISRYGHVSEMFVKEGQRVERGDKIAAVGNTGRSTGPHLHFELRRHGAAVNPMDYLDMRC